MGGRRHRRPGLGPGAPAALGALAGQSDHGATKSLYARDPDGNEFEVMWMVPRQHWGEFESSAPVLPLDLDAELARYS